LLRPGRVLRGRRPRATAKACGRGSRHPRLRSGAGAGGIRLRDGASGRGDEGGRPDRRLGVIVEVRIGSGEATTQLLERDVFTAFKVVVHGGDPPLAETTGVARVEEHAWISIDALRELAGEAATSAWEESLQGMLGYARSKGWVDDELNAVRAHVERPLS